MKRLQLDPKWPAEWAELFNYDSLELWGSRECLGYTYAYLNRRDQTLALIKKYVKPGARVLDVAAAQGNFSLALAEQGYKVTWNDIRANIVEYVKLKWEAGDINYVPGNVFEATLPEKFDLVVITEIIEHVAHPDDFLRRIAELVKPGGFIVMTTPNGEYFRNHLPRFSDCPDPSQFEAAQFKPNSDGHIFLLHRDEIRALSQAAGLELLEMKLLTNPLTNGHVKTGLLLPILPKALINGVEACTQRLPSLLRGKLHTITAAIFRRR